MLLGPEFFTIFAYLLLFWQLISSSFDAHLELFKSELLGSGKIIMAALGITLILLETLMITLYFKGVISGTLFTI